MNTIELTEGNIEELKQLLVADEIAKLRSDMEQMFTQVVIYMNSIHTRIEALHGEPVVEYKLGDGVVLGRDLAIKPATGHRPIPNSLNAPAPGLEIKHPSPRMVATGMVGTNGNSPA